MENIEFSFVVHPINLHSTKLIFNKFFNIASYLPSYTLKSIIKYSPPFSYIKLKDITSQMGSKATGNIIICPLLPEQFVTLDKRVVEKKILKAVNHGIRKGAKIIGLGGFTSIFSNQGIDIADKTNAAITTGNTFTAFLVIEGICKAAELIGLDLRMAEITIVGATGDIGSICSEVFSDKVRILNIVARDQAKLIKLSERLRKTSNAKINVMSYINDEAINSDVILTATSSISSLVDYKKLKSGAVVCDVSMPPNIARDVILNRNDVFVFEGGLAQFPDSKRNYGRRFSNHFPHGSIFGCFAELIVLALEKKYENFSIGKSNIDKIKIKEIGLMGEKHGFKLAQFSCGNKLYEKEDIQRIKEIVEQNKK